MRSWTKFFLVFFLIFFEEQKNGKYFFPPFSKWSTEKIQDWIHGERRIEKIGFTSKYSYLISWKYQCTYKKNLWIFSIECGLFENYQYKTNNFFLLHKRTFVHQSAIKLVWYELLTFTNISTNPKTAMQSCAHCVSRALK